MIFLRDISLSFGGQHIFDKLNLDIKPKDKIGLIGKNGVGKSSLLKIIVGEISPDSGTVSIAKDIRIGYLPQFLKSSDTQTVIQETLTAFEEINRLNSEFERLNEQLLKRSDYHTTEYMKLLDKITLVSNRLSLLEADRIEEFAAETLKGLGFREADFNKPTAIFSGGWRMRIEIAKLLLQKPNIFLLDEPTNHLDIQSIIWLENFLQNYDGAIVLISHDKRFLDAITNRTIELKHNKIYDFNLPFSKYLDLRKQIIKQQKQQYQNQQKKIKQTERFIEKFRYKATKAAQVQSRIRQLEKMQKIELDSETKNVKFSFPSALRSGDVVVEVQDITKAFDSHIVFKDANFTILRGEKVAFVGRNGEGKTTMARIIIGELTDFIGKLKIGHNVKIGYYAQNQEQYLDENKTVLQTLEQTASIDYTEGRLRSILGSFLFSDDDVLKKVKVLSGGERARLALAQLVLQPFNLLVLDEPTNHLDIYAKDVLKQALIHFTGTIIVISHDRDFLDGLVETIYEFDNQKVKQYKGDINYFLDKKKAQDFFYMHYKNLKQNQKKNVKENYERKLNYLQKKEQLRQKKRLENKIKNIEDLIEQLEEQINQYEQMFSEPTEQIDNSFFQKYDEAKKKLNQNLKLWEELNQQLENLDI